MEAVPVEVSERELRAGVRALAPADQPGPIRPVGEVDLASQFGHPRAVARLAALADRRPPGGFLERKQGFAHRFGELVAKREPDPRLPAGVGEIMARASRIRARQDVPIKRVCGNCSSARSNSLR